MLAVVTAIKLVAEIALFALIGRGVLALLAGRGGKNTIRSTAS
jgi:hypothetical protein